MGIRYFDHAASSWPKPPEVIAAMDECMLEYAANPGRGSHAMAVRASRALFDARRNLASLFHVKDPNHISFALNTTHALNQAIHGFVRAGDHVICTEIEHNSVRRPLEYLKAKRGIQITYLHADLFGNIDLADLDRSVQANTRLIVCNHSSNLLGNILPIAQIGEWAKRRGVKLLVDAAQTAGVLDIDVERMGIDMLAFPGHKGLLGPQGTGGLYAHPDMELEPFMQGGTGSRSEDIYQPGVRPDRYEAGTQNTVGIAGLNEGVKFVLEQAPQKIHRKEWSLTQRLMEGLAKIEGIRLLGPPAGQDRTGIVSFYYEHVDSSEAAFIFDQHFQIAVRSGYHCTPLAHRSAGTIEIGAVRASVGFYTTEEDVDYFIDSARQIGEQTGVEG